MSRQEAQRLVLQWLKHAQSECGPLPAERRGDIWCICLDVPSFHGAEYARLVRLGFRADVGEEIMNDSFRTFASDKNFTGRVSEAMLLRVLHAYCQQTPSHPNQTFAYRQGMNPLVGVLLFVMPEVNAFFTMNTIVHSQVPTYFLGKTEGQLAAARLLDFALQIVDPEVYAFLEQRNLTAQLYAFRWFVSFCSVTPPFNEELLRLWDFFVTFGFHLNVIICLSRVVSVRDQLMAEESPKAFLEDKNRKMPLNAHRLITLALILLPRLPPSFTADLRAHCHSTPTVTAINAYSQGQPNPYLDTQRSEEQKGFFSRNG